MDLHDLTSAGRFLTMAEKRPVFDYY